MNPYHILVGDPARVSEFLDKARNDIPVGRDVRLEELENDLITYSPERAEEIGVYLFTTKPGCGIRTMLKEGASHCQALVDAGRLAKVPFPWSEVVVNANGAQPSAAAWEWGKAFFQRLEKAGIAGPANQGQAREVKARGLTDALVKWKLNKRNGGDRDG